MGIVREIVQIVIVGLLIMALLPLGCKQLIVTGDNDVNVPSELTRAYATAAAEAGDPTQLLQFTVRPFREIVSRSRS